MSMTVTIVNVKTFESTKTQNRETQISHDKWKYKKRNTQKFHNKVSEKKTRRVNEL